MNYWILTSEFPPVSGGGISTYCYETVQMLVSKGHQVTVFTHDYSVSKVKEEVNDDFKTVRFNPDAQYTASFLGFEANLSYAFAEVVKGEIQKEGVPDVIEAQEYLGIAYYLLQFKWLGYELFKNIRVLLTLHSPSFLYLEYNQVNYHRLPYFWVGEMEKFCIASADMLISPSKYLVEELKKRMVFSNQRVYIVKNPYQSELPDAAPVLVKNKIVFFGKLTIQKGCLKLIEYFKQLWETGFNVPLIMIGSGNHLYHPEGMDMIDYIRHKYKKEIQEGRLRLLGSIQPNELTIHLSDAHVIIIPSLVDNLPYVVLEAMARGKVILTSIQGGQREIIQDGLNGFLFDHQQPDTFWKQLQRILSFTEAALNQIGDNARKTIKERYAYEAVYDQKVKLLYQLKQTGENTIFPFIRPIQTKRFIEKGKALHTPSLSVVIPYYNMGNYVKEAILSLKNADHKNIEILIVNDGSDEPQSVAVLKAIEEQYDVRVIHKKNEGLALARNTGAAEATGSFLAFLDADDTVEPSYYSKALRILQQYDNIYFVGCWAKYFGNAKGYWPAFNPEPPYLLFHNMVNSSALVYKKEAFLTAGLNDKDLIFGMEDYESVIHLVKSGYQGVALPEPLWNYRIRKNSMARAFTTEKQLYLYRLISQKHADIYAQHAAEIFNLLNANGPGINLENPTLIYNMPGTSFLGLRLGQRIVAKIKSKPRLRKVAILIKSKLS